MKMEIDKEKWKAFIDETGSESCEAGGLWPSITKDLKNQLEIPGKSFKALYEGQWENEWNSLDSVAKTTLDPHSLERFYKYKHELAVDEYTWVRAESVLRRFIKENSLE